MVKMYIPKVTMKIAPPMMTSRLGVDLSNRCILLWSEKGVKHLGSVASSQLVGRICPAKGGTIRHLFVCPKPPPLAWDFGPTIVFGQSMQCRIGLSWGRGSTPAPTRNSRNVGK